MTELPLATQGRYVSIELLNTSHIGFTYFGYRAAGYDVVVLRFHGSGIIGQPDPDIPFCCVIYPEGEV